MMTAALRRVPFFADLTDAQLSAVAASGSTTTLHAQQIVFREGDPADAMYVIESGQARVYKADQDGNEVELNRPVAGDFFGEMALLDGGLRSATVAAVTACTCFVLGRQAFLQTLITSPELLAQLMSALTSKIRRASDDVLRKEMAARELAAEAELQRHRALSQMVAGVAHEVNTPLGIARTAVGVIRNALVGDGDRGGASDADALEALDLLERNILRAHKLVQDFKKVSVGQITDTKEQLSLPEVVGETVNLFRIEARSAGLDIEVIDELRDTDGSWIGYRGYLTQVLMNLLTNAARYAYPGGGGGAVEVRLAADLVQQQRCFTVSVRDFGTGIPAADAEKIFEPFFTTGRSRGGTGLGMAIVHNIVTAALRGTIRLDSPSGGGTAFHVTFPRSIPD